MNNQTPPPPSPGLVTASTRLRESIYLLYNDHERVFMRFIAFVERNLADLEVLGDRTHTPQDIAHIKAIMFARADAFHRILTGLQIITRADHRRVLDEFDDLMREAQPTVTPQVVVVNHHITFPAIDAPPPTSTITTTTIEESLTQHLANDEATPDDPFDIMEDEEEKQEEIACSPLLP